MDTDYNQFMMIEYQDPDRSKRIPMSYLKEEWRDGVENSRGILHVKKGMLQPLSTT